MNIKQMIAKGLLISLMAGAVTGCSAVREKDVYKRQVLRSPGYRTDAGQGNGSV